MCSCGNKFTWRIRLELKFANDRDVFSIEQLRKRERVEKRLTLNENMWILKWIYRNSWLFKFDFVTINEIEQMSFEEYCTSIGLIIDVKLYVFKIWLFVVTSHRRTKTSLIWDKSYSPYHRFSSYIQRHSSSIGDDLVCHRDATAALPMWKVVSVFFVLFTRNVLKREKM